MTYTGTIHAYDPRKGYGRIKCADFGTAHVLFYQQDCDPRVPMEVGVPVMFRTYLDHRRRRVAVGIIRDETHNADQGGD